MKREGAYTKMENIDKLWFLRLISDGMVLSNVKQNRLYGKSIPEMPWRFVFKGIIIS